MYEYLVELNKKLWKELMNFETHIYEFGLKWDFCEFFLRKHQVYLDFLVEMAM